MLCENKLVDNLIDLIELRNNNGNKIPEEQILSQFWSFIVGFFFFLFFFLVLCWDSLVAVWSQMAALKQVFKK